MFDRFSILSGPLFWSHNEGEDDWPLEDRAELIWGTHVTMVIHKNSERTRRQVFDPFADPSDQGYAFSRTHVPHSLARYGPESLVSRSQAKRVLARFDRFREVLLDFEKVDSLGQAFADEIFRVFARKHPQIRLVVLNAVPEVEKRIARRTPRLRSPVRRHMPRPGALSRGIVPVPLTMTVAWAEVKCSGRQDACFSVVSQAPEKHWSGRGSNPQPQHCEACQPDRRKASEASGQ